MIAAILARAAVPSMAALALLAAGVTLAPAASAQLTPPGTKKCRPLVVDVAKGTVNGLGPAAPLAKVKKKLPCFTGGTAEGDLYNYGGGSFYRDHNLYFYTYLRFTEIRAPFNGTLSIPVFERSREALLAELKPSGIQGRPNWGTPADEFVTMDWGCLQLTFAGDRAKQIRFYTRPCGDLYNPR
ncbi:hypothetical protein [Sphingomonas sp. G-3-2-10]|uniref:hypothetical protein n=1 Tax=Sphingomonas sp. G-3-2-10 TaxID=2728838 RepID=UPI00146E2144|nr:hypothetical protein [Sphingomonas sp. G-3-2-10]NML06207.1 hypothetical protein [Sphingomonas sp. G-3-2-10]